MQKALEYIKLKFFRFFNRILGTTFTFSADGEDIILRKFLSGLDSGFYVDLGAHDYKDGSNTFYFYLLGWSGICVDPLPGIKKKFLRYRPRDIFIDKAVISNASSSNKIDFNYYKDFPDNSTTSEQRILDLKNNFKRSPSSVIQVETISISNLVKNYIGSKEVNLLNIDIEGGETDILKNIIDNKIYPWIICVEEIGKYADNIISDSSTYKLLNENSYLFMGRTFLTSIYLNKKKFDKLKSPYMKDLYL